MTTVKGGESLAVLQNRRANQGIAKLQGVATAIAPQSLSCEVAGGGVDGHGH